MDPRSGERRPARIFHDLRRSGVRNTVQAAVPPSVAMEISGHRTHAVFARNAMASEAQKREALRQTQAHLARQPARGPVPLRSYRAGG